MKELDYEFGTININLIDVNLKTIYYFTVVAEVQNITKAAKKLYVTQSALSKNLMMLEEKAGSRLLKREGRSLQLTEAGKYLYTKWKQLIKTYCREVEQAEIISHGGVREIRLGCFPAMHALAYIRPYTHRLHRQRPELFLEIFRMNYNRLVEYLSARKVDVIITLLNDLPENKDEYEWKELEKLPMTAVMKKDNPLAEKKKLKFSDLQGARLFFSEPEGSLSRMKKFRELCRMKEVQPAEIICVNNDLTAMLNVELTGGITIGIRPLYEEENRELKIMEIEDVLLPVAAVWNRDSREEIKDILKSVF